MSVRINEELFTKVSPERRKPLILVLEYVIGIFVKLPLFTFLALELILMNDIAFKIIRPLLKFRFLKKTLRVFQLLHNYLVGRTLLLVLCYVKYESIFSTDLINQRNLQSHLFYVPQSSPLEAFVLITYFSPSFTQISINSDRHCRIRIISYAKAIVLSFFERGFAFEKNQNWQEASQVYDEIVHERIGPLIIYYQGGVTNGHTLVNLGEPFVEMDNLLKDHVQRYRENKGYTYRSLYVTLFDDSVRTFGNSASVNFFNILTNSFHIMLMRYQPIRLPALKESLEEIIIKRFQLGISKDDWRVFEQRESHRGIQNNDAN